jgi:DNA polymerase
VADAAPALADVLREARALIALQRRLAGPVRYLGGTEAETTTEAAPVPDSEPTPPASAERPAEPLTKPGAEPLQPRAEAEPPAPATVDAEDLPDDDVPDLFGDLPDPSLDETLSPYERIEALIPEGHPLRDLDSLGEVRDWLAANELVPIDRDRINPVLGTGDPEADLMIVGEAPGADEDRTGEPFVGRAGQLLNKILEAVHFQREDVYITNILKSRPPNNRDPLPEEVEAHLPILHKQIALVRPRMILAVGKSAGNGLLGKKSSLASLRGTFNDYYGLPLMVTYHPAALLRNPQWKRPTWEDVKLLRTRYDQLTSGA